MKFLHNAGEGESKDLQDNDLPGVERPREQQHVIKAEDERRHVYHRSASPVRKVRLGLSNLKFPHDELNIHHTMHEVMTLKYASFVSGCGTLSLASGQVMNLRGNRRRPKRTQRFIDANAGSPTGRESQGDGTPIVPAEREQGGPDAGKGQPTKVGQSVPDDSGTQGRYQEVYKRGGMRNANN
jgi:hypothetical protein